MPTVSNAGPLIHPSWINQLDLLQQLFGTIVVPVAVQQEVLTVDPAMLGLAHVQAAFAANWVDVRAVVDRPQVRALQVLIDLGEAEAIALALEIGAERILFDDRRARSEAERRGLDVLGTVGILRAARGRSLIPSAASLLADLRRTGFWCSESLFKRVLDEESISGTM